MKGKSLLSLKFKGKIFLNNRNLSYGVSQRNFQDEWIFDLEICKE